MFDIVKCFIALIVLLLLFYYWGNAFNSILKIKLSHWIEKSLAGFFVYFILFQFVALFMIIGLKPFSALCKVWGILVIILSAAMFPFFKRDNFSPKTGKKEIAIFLIFLAALIGYIVTRPYVGWDTVHYIGVMNESVYTDTMYCFDPDNGLPLTELRIKDIFNAGFFMQFAFISKLLSIKPVITAYYLMRSMGVCLFSGIMILIGRLFYKDDIGKVLGFSAGVGLMNLCFSTILSTEFFNLRLYEGKGFCQNVIIPATLYCIINIYRKNEDIFRLLFIIGMASVPISMSSILVFPLMVGILCISIWVTNPKQFSILIKGAICTIPNIIYFALYYLNKLDIMTISIK